MAVPFIAYSAVNLHAIEILLNVVIVILAESLSHSFLGSLVTKELVGRTADERKRIVTDLIGRLVIEEHASLINQCIVTRRLHNHLVGLVEPLEDILLLRLAGALGNGHNDLLLGIMEHVQKIP